MNRSERSGRHQVGTGTVAVEQNSQIGKGRRWYCHWLRTWSAATLFHVRWRERLMQEGRSPDPRFTMANERTFLAWIRTSVAVIAGGLGIQTFAPNSIPSWLRTVVAALLLVIGAALALGSFLRWRSAEAAMRRGDELTVTALAPLVAVGVAVVALLLLVVVLLRGA